MTSSLGSYDYACQLLRIELIVLQHQFESRTRVRKDTTLPQLDLARFVFHILELKRPRTAAVLLPAFRICHGALVKLV